MTYSNATIKKNNNNLRALCLSDKKGMVTLLLRLLATVSINCWSASIHDQERILLFKME